MQTTNVRPLCVVCSDLHLSHRRPKARAEQDWYGTMAASLACLNEHAKSLAVPIIYAGDIFHSWNEPVELVNFAIGNMPHGYGIPGQHDLPHHNLGEIYRSAFWNLTNAGVLQHIGRSNCGIISGWSVQAFPWGEPIEITKNAPKDHQCLAVCHAYIWSGNATKYHDAPDEKNISKYRKRLEGFDAAVFGDNHRHFMGKTGHCNVFNNGCFIQRRIDERDYAPGFGVLQSDGTWFRIEEKDSKAKWKDDKDNSEFEASTDFAKFLKVLQDEKGSEFDVVDFIEKWMEKNPVSAAAKKRLEEVLHKQKKG